MGAQADEIAAALPTLLDGAAGLEAAMLSGDRALATNALSSENDAALTALLHTVRSHELNAARWSASLDEA